MTSVIQICCLKILFSRSELIGLKIFVLFESIIGYDWFGDFYNKGFSLGENLLFNKSDWSLL